jgi:hypothetical protein
MGRVPGAVRLAGVAVAVPAFATCRRHERRDVGLVIARGCRGCKQARAGRGDPNRSWAMPRKLEPKWLPCSSRGF